MTFDYENYPLKFIQKQPCKDETNHLFTLIYKFYSPITGYHYIIHADYHTGNVFALKFYCKKDKRSDFKYSKIVNKGDVGKILVTCATLVPILLEQFPNSSFVFTSSRTVDIRKKIEGLDTNSRFRIYRYFVSIKFGNETFEHIEYPQLSSYLLINRLNENLDEKQAAIEKILVATYPELTL